MIVLSREKNNNNSNWWGANMSMWLKRPMFLRSSSSRKYCHGNNVQHPYILHATASKMTTFWGIVRWVAWHQAQNVNWWQLMKFFLVNCINTSFTNFRYGWNLTSIKSSEHSSHILKHLILASLFPRIRDERKQDGHRKCMSLTLFVSIVIAKIRIFFRHEAFTGLLLG